MTDFGGRRMTENSQPARLPDLLRAAADEIEELEAQPAPFPPMTIRKIRFSVGVAWNVSEVDIISKRRSPAVVFPRFAGYHLSKKLTTHSFAVIGRSFRRDHTTIIRGVYRAKVLLEENPDFREKYNLCLSILSNYTRDSHERYRPV